MTVKQTFGLDELENIRDNARFLLSKPGWNPLWRSALEDLAKAADYLHAIEVRKFHIEMQAWNHGVAFMKPNKEDTGKK